MYTNKWKITGVFLLIFIAFAGCYPDGPEYVDELDLVLTVHDESLDYSAFNRFVMPDTVVFITNGRDSEISDDQEEYILNEVATSFQAAGWTKVDTPDTSASGDVILLVSVLKNVNLSLSYGWWGYWDWWYGWGYYPGYPGGGYYPMYPGYCCYSSIYSYEDGTLMIEMLDPNSPVYDDDADAQGLPVVWGGFCNGLLQGSTSSLNRRISTSIDQMISDSPYLIK